MLAFAVPFVLLAFAFVLVVVFLLVIGAVGGHHYGVPNVAGDGLGPVGLASQVEVVPPLLVAPRLVTLTGVQVAATVSGVAVAQLSLAGAAAAPGAKR